MSSASATAKTGELTPAEKAQAINHVGLRCLPINFEAVWRRLNDLLLLEFPSREEELDLAVAELKTCFGVDSAKAFVTACQAVSEVFSSPGKLTEEKLKEYGLPADLVMRLWAGTYDGTPLKELARFTANFIVDRGRLTYEFSEEGKNTTITSATASGAKPQSSTAEWMAEENRKFTEKSYQDFAAQLSTILDPIYHRIEKTHFCRCDRGAGEVRFLSECPSDNWVDFRSIASRRKLAYWMLANRTPLYDAHGIPVEGKIVLPYLTLLLSIITSETNAKADGRVPDTFVPELYFPASHGNLELDTEREPLTSPLYVVTFHDAKNGGPGLIGLCPDIGDFDLSLAFEKFMGQKVDYTRFVDAVMENCFKPGSLSKFEYRHTKIVLPFLSMLNKRRQAEATMISNRR